MQSNFFYTRCITPKSVTSLRGPSRGHCSCGSTAPFKELSELWQAVDNTVSDLICPRFEPQTFRSKDERVQLDQLSGK